MKIYDKHLQGSRKLDTGTFLERLIGTDNWVLVKKGALGQSWYVQILDRLNHNQFCVLGIPAYLVSKDHTNLPLTFSYKQFLHYYAVRFIIKDPVVVEPVELYTGSEFLQIED